MPAARVRTIGWVSVTLLAVVFAPYATLAMWHLVTPGAPHPTSILLDNGVDWDFANGGGAHSTIHTTDHAYRHSLGAMLFHTIAGGLLLLLGPWQFSGRLRRRRPALHRRLGVAYLVAAVTTSLGGLAFLLRTPLDGVISGPVFALQLAVLGVGTLVTAGLAMAAIRRGDVMVHMRFMALNFGLFMATPVQRADWVVIGNLAPSTRQVDANIMSVMHLGPLVILGAVVASRSLDRRTSVPGVSGLIVPRKLLVALQPVGLVSLAVLIALVDGLGRMGHLGLMAFAPLLLVFWVAVAVMEARARRRGDDLAASEWGTHLAAIVVTPTLVLPAYLLLRAAGADLSAYFAAVVLVWPSMQYTASLVVAGRLHRGWFHARLSRASDLDPSPARASAVASA